MNCEQCKKTFLFGATLALAVSSPRVVVTSNRGFCSIACVAAWLRKARVTGIVSVQSQGDNERAAAIRGEVVEEAYRARVLQLEKESGRDLTDEEAAFVRGEAEAGVDAPRAHGGLTDGDADVYFAASIAGTIVLEATFPDAAALNLWWMSEKKIDLGVPETGAVDAEPAALLPR